MHRKGLKSQTRRSLVGFAFILPWFIGAVLFFITPMILSFLFSVNEVNPKTFEFSYIGFGQYKDFFVKDASFLPTLLTSIRDMLFSVVLVMFFSLFIARILVDKFKGRVFFQTIFFLPFILSSSLVFYRVLSDQYMGDVAGSTESFMFQLTLLRNILESANLGADITNIVVTMLDSMLNISMKCGLQIVVFMAGLRNISDSVKEAAKIEGATEWEYFWKIAFPLISPVFQLNLIYSIIDSFTDYNNLIVGYIEGYAHSLELTKSTALAILYYTLVFVIIGIVLLLIRKKVFYYVD